LRVLGFRSGGFKTRGLDLESGRAGYAEEEKESNEGLLDDTASSKRTQRYLFKVFGSKQSWCYHSMHALCGVNTPRISNRVLDIAVTNLLSRAPSPPPLQCLRPHVAKLTCAVCFPVNRA
jgi:hypothetical protein